MKLNFKTTMFFAMFFLILFSGCQKEDLNVNVTNQSQETIKVSAEELLMLLMNPDIKNSVLKNTQITKSLEDYSGNQDNYFTKVHLPEYDTYTLFLESYTTETPYYEFFIVTVQNDIQKDGNNEMGFYSQYIPTEENYDSSQPFDVGKFVGTLNIFDLDHSLIGSGTVSKSTGTGIVTICNTSLAITEMTCSHSGEHGVGDTCSPPLVNDAYYVQIEVITDCFEQIAYIGGATGGGGVPPPSTGSIFLNKLNPEDKAFLDANIEVRSSVLIYLETTTDSETEANAFAYELIDIAKYLKEEYGELGNDELNAIRMTRQTKLKGYFTTPFDANYYQVINPYLEVDTQNPAMVDPIHMYYTMQCAILKAQHPEWSMFKVYAVAAVELIHIGLDVARLVPAVGEVADLANGVIYTIEGDGLNATLSYAAAIPFAGWASTGAKYAYKAINIAGTSKTTLKWIVKADNIITFGNRAQLRKVLNLTDPAKQAHHIIPWGKSSNEVVQRAAKSGNEFHMNEALNGIAVANWRNQPNHTAYDNKIAVRLTNFINANPNATPNQCYDALMDIIADAKQAIINNPNVHLNDLNF